MKLAFMKKTSTRKEEENRLMSNLIIILSCLIVTTVLVFLSTMEQQYLGVAILFACFTIVFDNSFTTRKQAYLRKYMEKKE